MKVLVPIKRVPDPYAKVRPLADGSGLDLGGTKHEINPFDEIALEAAVQLKEAGSVSEIVVVSVGGAECEDQLRKALAMGADRAILVEITGAVDSNAVADILKKCALDENPRLVLMGKQATDFDSNQVGQMLAAKLSWNLSTCASKIMIEELKVTVVRETDGGEQTEQFLLPAVITSDLRLAEPRYIALPGIIKARSKPLDRQKYDASTKKSNLISEFYESPPAREAGIKVSSVDELVAALAKKDVF